MSTWTLNKVQSLPYVCAVSLCTKYSLALLSELHPHPESRRAPAVLLRGLRYRYLCATLYYVRIDDNSPSSLLFCSSGSSVAKNHLHPPIHYHQPSLPFPFFASFPCWLFSSPTLIRPPPGCPILDSLWPFFFPLFFFFLLLFLFLAVSACGPRWRLARFSLLLSRVSPNSYPAFSSPLAFASGRSRVPSHSSPHRSRPSTEHGTPPY